MDTTTISARSSWLASAALALAAFAMHAQAEEAESPPDLWTAAGEGDIAALQAHHAAGTSLDKLQPELGVTPLTVAVVRNQAEAVDWLLANGADVNARGGDGGTTLMAAVFTGNAAAAKRLLDEGADLAASNDQGQTALDIAALDWETTSYLAGMLQLALNQQELEAGRAEIMALFEPLLAAAARSDIWLATYLGYAEAVQAQLDSVDVNRRNADSGATLLSVAAALGHADIAALLLEAGAEVDGRNYTNGTTALHAAAIFGRADVVKLLLDNGAKVDAMGDDGSTPLAVAQTDWATTQFVGSLLRMNLNEQEVTAGKAEVVKLLQAKP